MILPDSICCATSMAAQDRWVSCSMAWMCSVEPYRDCLARHLLSATVSALYDNSDGKLPASCIFFVPEM